jgi:diguanylate cyclase
MLFETEFVQRCQALGDRPTTGTAGERYSRTVTSEPPNRRRPAQHRRGGDHDLDAEAIALRERGRAVGRFRITAAVLISATVAVVAVVGTGVLGVAGSEAVNDLGQLAFGALAAAFCWRAWRRLQEGGQGRGPGRAWLLLLFLGMAGWTCGQAIWSWYQIFGGRDIPSPSLADVGYFALPVFAFPALLLFPADAFVHPAASGGTQQAPGNRRAKVLFTLDALVIVGSLFVLSWSTTIGAAVRAGAPTAAEFAVAVGYPTTDAVLVVMVLLLVTFRRPENPVALRLLAGGLLALSVSDSFFLYLVSIGADQIPPVCDFGFVVGPVLIALAAAAPKPTASAESTSAESTSAESTSAESTSAAGPPRPLASWLTTMLPYLPLAGIVVLVVTQRAMGAEVDLVETYGLVLLVCVVVLRQMLTLLENEDLLRRVRDSQDRLVGQAFHDSLTGLPNRMMFSERLEAAVRNHRRKGTSLALFFCDVDDLKPVNDGLGHAMGDALLRVVGERLSGSVRADDIVARIGGDEFAVIVSDYQDDPESIGRRMMAAFGESVLLGGQPYRPAVSVGLVVADPADRGRTAAASLNADTLLNRADAAMYVAKRAGKGQLVVFRPGMQTGTSEQGLTADLRQSLALGAVRLVYQPIIRFSDGEVVAIEALARWSHPTKGPIAPGDLISAAAYGGLLFSLDEVVLDTACRDIRRLRRRGGRDVVVHVNVSSSTVTDHRLVGAVHDALRRHDLPGKAVVLEITETARIDDIATAAEVCVAVRRHGVRFALDDLGTGYSSLNYLLRLPIDVVKLDRSLITADAEPAKAAAIGSGAVHIAQRLGIQLVAEGIESATQVARLADLGCELGQGYLLAPPMPLEQLELPAGNQANAG